MITTTGKRLSDYFAEIQSSPAAVRRQQHKPQFSSVLREAIDWKGDGEHQPPGMTIQDYFARITPRVRSLTPASGTGQEEFSGATPAEPVQPDRSGSSGCKSDGFQQPAGIIETSIREAALRYDLPESLIRGVIRFESNFQPDAVSPAGAQGLMQLMPATARELGVENPFDIRQNIDGGVRYLRQMLDRFDGDTEKALAAYNAGPGTVMRYGGIPPYRETQTYVKRVMAYVNDPAQQATT